MAKQAMQKLKLLYLKDFLLSETDEDHPASMAQILEYLSSKNIPAERKTIYDDIEELRYYGLDIINIRGKNGGYFAASHDFDLAELKLLVDSVQASKFISLRKTNALIHKLESLTDVYSAGQLHRQVYVQNRVKATNEVVFNVIDRIHAAINDDRAIKFKYFYYTAEKKEEFRRNGDYHTVSPFSLIWDSENYYLLCFDESAGQMRHYRVDKMKNVSIIERERTGKAEFESMDMSSYNSKVFGMYRGAEEKVEMRFSEGLAGVVIDRFGKDVIMVPDGDGHFVIRRDIEVSPQFFGWAAGLGSGCEIIAPASVREKMKQFIGEINEIYK